jgi:hypothetical protein
MRGFHVCELCPRSADDMWPWPPLSVQEEEGEFFVGSAEIRVPAGDGTTFAAPDMIIHYVTEHGYRPPDSFLDALVVLDVPGTSPGAAK